jgi:hypothetical protein
MITLSAGITSSLPATSTGRAATAGVGRTELGGDHLDALDLAVTDDGHRLPVEQELHPFPRAFATSRRLPGMLASSRR